MDEIFRKELKNHGYDPDTEAPYTPFYRSNMEQRNAQDLVAQVAMDSNTTYDNDRCPSLCVTDELGNVHRYPLVVAEGLVDAGTAGTLDGLVPPDDVPHGSIGRDYFTFAIHDGGELSGIVDEYDAERGVIPTMPWWVENTKAKLDDGTTLYLEPTGAKWFREGVDPLDNPEQCYDCDARGAPVIPGHHPGAGYEFTDDERVKSEPTVKHDKTWQPKPQ